ncbi:MAG: transcriptional regulator [Bradyrhizobium sp.]
MGRLAVTWRSEDGRQAWLAKLLDAMEEASRPEIRARPLDRAILAALRAQLAMRPSVVAYGGSVFSLRN